MPARNEHVVAIMLEPVSMGQEFIDWPLHITIVPWFPCGDAKKLDRILTDAAGTQAGFSLEVGKIEKFGPKKNIKVNLMKESPMLDKLHWNIFNVLEKNSFGIHQKEYVGDGYRPHITYQPHGHSSPGDQFQVKFFTLIKQIRQKKNGTMVKSAVKDYRLG